MAIENGDTVKVHYVGSLEDGTIFDSSRQPGRGPLEFTVGAGTMIPGFEKAVKGRECGETIKVTIPCAEAYGPVDRDRIFTVARSQVPPHIPQQVGTRVELSNGQQVIHAVISDVDPEVITLDANHELAGKDLVFEIEIVSVN